MDGGEKDTLPPEYKLGHLSGYQPNLELASPSLKCHFDIKKRLLYYGADTKFIYFIYNKTRDDKGHSSV